MAVGVRRREKEGTKLHTRHFSSLQEKKVAKTINGKQTANSGATMFGGKGDVLTSGDESFLIECKTKTTNSDSISIKRDWFRKNKEEMVFQGKQHQAVVFNFGPDEPYNENHYIIDEYLFLELQEYLNGKEK